MLCSPQAGVADIRSPARAEKKWKYFDPLKPTSCCIVVVSQLKYWLFKILEILGNIRNILEELPFWLCDIKANELELPSLFDAVKLQGDSGLFKLSDEAWSYKSSCKF